jgi:hypothetical protein
MRNILSGFIGARGRDRFVPGSFDGKEITTAVSLRLLLLEMLYEGESFKKSRVQERLSKKSPSRFLVEMQKKMTSQNAPQSTIS